MLLVLVAIGLLWKMAQARAAAQCAGRSETQVIAIPIQTMNAALATGRYRIALLRPRRRAIRQPLLGVEHGQPDRREHHRQARAERRQQRQSRAQRGPSPPKSAAAPARKGTEPVRRSRPGQSSRPR